RDQSVEAALGERPQHRVDSALELVRIRARRADDRAAARQDPGDLARPQRLELAVDEPAPAGADPEHVPPVVEQPPPRGSDYRIQTRAVAAAGEDSSPHPAILEVALH